VDLHFHLLPGVDDGPEQMADSLELAFAAVEEGTGTVVATPHVRTDYLTDVSSLPDRVAEVRAALEREGIPVEVLCGGELGHDMVGRLRQAELDLIAQGPPDSRWLLVEAPFTAMAGGFHDALEELLDRGFGVVIAHPERSSDAAIDDSVGLRRALARGAVAQVNALSLTGGHGEDARRAGRRLVAEGLVAVVGSDAHGPTRPPALTRASEALLAHGVDEMHARALTLAGPRRLLSRGVAGAGAPLGLAPAPRSVASYPHLRGVRTSAGVPT
jgi:protein-tyrosine phosphatase